jgi:hypothetical protein
MQEQCRQTRMEEAETKVERTQRLEVRRMQEQCRQTRMEEAETEVERTLLLEWVRTSIRCIRSASVSVTSALSRLSSLRYHHFGNRFLIIPFKSVRVANRKPCQDYRPTHGYL